MTTEPLLPVIVEPADQRDVSFLGALSRIRIDGGATGGVLSVMEHRHERGHATPLHRHDIADETFLMIEGTLRVEVDGELYSAGAGAMAFLPRERTHRFIVTSPTAHFLILHTPSGFEDFVTATPQGASPAQLKEIAASYGIEILGPPLTL